METKVSNLLQETVQSTTNSTDQQLNNCLVELDENLTKLIINKIDALKSKQSKSRSGSLHEIVYSPTKILNELNFYNTKSGFKDIEHHLNEDEHHDHCEPESPSSIEQTNHKKSDNQMGNQLLKFKQIKQLNEFLLLKKSLHSQISNSDRFELDSLYSTSTELNRGLWQLDDGEFVLQCLNRHNYLRKLHGVSNLNLSQNLINYSRDWVEILARNDRLEKRFANRFGENVFVMQLDDESTSLNGAIPVDHWYHQGVNYDYTSQYPKNSTSDFTQLIWKSTRFLGAACARSKTNRIFVVASYSVSGNFPRQMVENVLPIAK